MPSSFQFSLLTLMAVTLWVSLMCVAHSVLGVGAVLASFAAGLFAFNAAGTLEKLQHGGLRAGLIMVAWCVFIVSFFVPAVVAFDPILGWEAAWLVAETVLVLPNSSSDLLDYFFSTCITLANLMMALSPIALLTQRTGAHVWHTALFCLLAATAFVCCFNDAEGLTIGYYLWNSSFLMTVSATRLHTYTAAAAITTMMLWIMVAWTLY